jgi:membrane associated rhomboid family serine protease
MKDIIQQLKTQFKSGDITIKLIFICVGIFVLSAIVNLSFFQKTLYSVEDLFAAKATLNEFFSQPWGILTYTFFHGNLWHLLLNMLMLFFVGKLFLRYFRSEDFLIFFLFGSIFGALFFMLFSPVFHYGESLVGASAGLYAIFFALVAYIPKTKVQLMFLNFNIPLDYIGYALIGFDVLMIAMGDQNLGGHISHLGGASFGFLYMKQFEKGKDFLGKFFRSLFSKKKLKVEKGRKTPPRDDYEFNAQKVQKQQEIDKILDKISRSGYESLTKSEKDTLFKAGKNG